jgi:hypothetical protein
VVGGVYEEGGDEGNKENEDLGGGGGDDDDGYASGGAEEVGYGRHADDMHEHMSGLLRDLDLFRRKIGDDKTRFWDEVSRRRPLGARTNII